MVRKRGINQLPISARRGVPGPRSPMPDVATPPTCSVTLLARTQARSDDLDADSLEQPLVAPAIHPFTGTFAASEHSVAFGSKVFDLDADSLEQPLVAPAIHPFTGTFAASEHSVAFGSKVFRLVFPLHVVALALLVCVAVSVVLTLGTVPGRPLMTYLLVTTLLALGLGARIAVHRWNCQAKAQRFGATAWTIIVVCGCTADFIAYVLPPTPKPACEIPSMYVYPSFSALFALINASHGMEFWHTALLAGLVLCDFITVRTVCADSSPVNLAIVALVVTFGAGHFAQLLARHAFLQSEHIQTSRERLEYDVQRLEYRLSGSSIARFPTVATESSTCATTISAAPQQALRKVRSAPAVMDGGHNALLAGLVLCRWPLPYATYPSTDDTSTAGPSTVGPSTASAPLSASVPLSASAPPPPLPSPCLSASAPLFPGSPLDDRVLLNSPVFTLSSKDIARRGELVAQMESERQEDEASDVLSQHGDASEMPWGSWSTSDPSTATRNRRRMIRAIYELRHGISGPANAAATRRCPYI